MTSTDKLGPVNPGDDLTVAGIVLVRQRPGSASGTVFVTLEDEHGIVNLIVWKRAFEKYRGIVMGAKLIACRGRLQREGTKPHEVVHIVAEELFDLSPLLDRLQEKALSTSNDLAGMITQTDEVAHPGAEHRGTKRSITLHSRDFH